MNNGARHRNLAACVFAGLSLVSSPALAGPAEEIHAFEDCRYDAMIGGDANA